MNERYDFASIESKWQTKWAEEKLYQVTEDDDQTKVLLFGDVPISVGQFTYGPCA